MATQSPFSFLSGLAARGLAGPQLPAWMVSEIHQRLVLFLNHVLMQEPEAMERLLRQKGRVARMQWRQYSLALSITPAGLFNVAPEDAEPDLLLEIAEPSPLVLAQAALRGDKPAIRIKGDVQLAAEINWLADNVQWDAEEDLARLIGDVPAHTLGRVVRTAIQALRQFVGARMGEKAKDPAAAVPAGAAPVAAMPGGDSPAP